MTATFKPTQTAAPAGASPRQSGRTAPTENMEIEYTAVRKDLRKLGFTIVGSIAVIAGLFVLNDQTNFIGGIGEQLFRLWE